ncbi:MAG: hypothetical protein COB38_01505 [Gammaproteobacteria bacterium]|nr:MAG: hypothetical protein COB38_01505 [Gammaproteobacteria bacterium]
MEEALQWGIEVVLWFQRFSPTLDIPFEIFSHSGNELFYLLFMPAIIWCISPRIGIRLLILTMASTYLNALAKLLIDQPRPFNYDSRVKELMHATGGGLPSGHTQNALVFWSYIAASFKSKKLWILAGVMMVFVPLSRVYLGVHFPTDLLGGYLLGIAVLLLFMKIEEPIIDWLKQKNIIYHLALSLTIPTLLILLAPEVDPTISGISGVLMGALIGLSFEQQRGDFDIPKSIVNKVISYFVGIAILFAFYVGLKMAFSGLEPQPVFRFIKH